MKVFMSWCWGADVVAHYSVRRREVVEANPAGWWILAITANLVVRIYAKCCHLTMC